MNVNFDFNTPPADNVAFIKAKKPQISFDYDEIKFEAHQRAFTVAKVTQIELLSEIQESLENAFVEGQSFESWMKELKPTLQKRGWLGAVEVTNPKTGEPKSIFVGARRLKTIFYTNARTAYAQSEARTGYELPLSQYIRYVAIMDNRVRPEHAALHGKIAHRDDKFWATNYPPNGWNCRCAVEFVSKDEMDEHGWAEMSDIEKKLNFAEDDWAYDTRGLNNPTQYLQDIIKDKLELYKQKHARGAVLALNAVKDKLVQNEGRYQVMKKLWDSEDLELTANICEINKDLKDKMGATAQYISIKAQTMEAHKENSKYKPPKGVKMPNPHPEITAFDYSIIPYMLESSEKQLFRDGENIYIVASRLGIYYRLVLKNLPKKKEVWVSSLMSREKKEDLLPNLKGKREIK